MSEPAKQVKVKRKVASEVKVAKAFQVIKKRTNVSDEVAAALTFAAVLLHAVNELDATLMAR